jgi:hypothetical protein
MPRMYVVVGVAAVIIAGYLVFRSPSHERILIPEGFRGPYVVAFSHPRGVKAKRTWNAYVYQVPRDGILRLKNARSRGFRWVEHYYVSPTGALTLIPSESPLERDPTVRSARVRGGRTGSTQFGDSQESIDWHSASIGIPADEGSFGSNPHFLVSAVLEEYRRADAQSH